VGSIILLALAAAIYPQLLAVVIVILTRPNPQPLLWACYLASLLVSVGASILIFTVFESRGTIAGTSSHRVGPAAYLVVGATAVVVAIVMTTRRGRDQEPRERRRRPGSATVAKTRARAEDALGEGSFVVAGLVGALLAIPGPFDFLAVGRLARNGYGVLAAAGVMLVFALIKFALIEVPIVGYAFDPDGTAARVARFSRWMHANKLLGVAAIVGLFGVLLVARGIAGLS
jgi:Sap, sulfolipid-1-addressing protein